MKSIFLRIFFVFWLTAGFIELLSLLIAATSPEAAPLSPLMRRLNDVSSTMTATYAQGAAEVYERDGAAGLNGYLTRMARAGHTPAWLFDSVGRPVASGTGFLPAGAATLARKTALNGRPNVYFSGSLIERSQTAIGSSGTRYVFVITSELDTHMTLTGTLTRLVTVLLVTGLACWRLAASVVSPVLILRSVAQRYATGDLSARVGGTLGRRQDELGELGRDFDVMAVRLENLALAQRRLLWDISHELRSPLARLVLALALIRRQAGDSEALNRIEREAGRLDSLIDRLLILARLESGLDPAHAQRINIAQLTREITEDADFEARSRKRRVDYQDQGAEDAEVVGDATLLRSAIENVVRNALHYTPIDSRVQIILQNLSHQVHIQIRDYGSGVPNEALQEIFRPFYRVGEARDRESGGVGLGLSITARAMSLHGGGVTARNMSDGGLCVVLSLPKAKL